MKLTNLVIAIATFATITLSSSAYIATQDVTSAVIVDKAKHSLDLTTNGLHHISLSEAYAIDRSEASQINFLRCSFARPEFRFSWFCHQQKIDGKMTKNSYVALKDDQQKYFKENVIKSVGYEAQKWILRAEQLRLGTAINNLSKTELSNQSEKNERFKEAMQKFKEATQIAKDVQIFNEKYKALNDVANSEIQEKATGENGDLKSLENVGYGMMKAALQLHRINSPVGSGAAHSQKKVYASDLDSIMKETEANESKATGVKGEAGVLNEIVEVGRVLTKTDTNIVSTKSLKDLNIEALKEFSGFKVYEGLAGSDRTGVIDWNKDFEQAGSHDHRIVNMLLNQDKQVLDSLGLVAADKDVNLELGKYSKARNEILISSFVYAILATCIISLLFLIYISIKVLVNSYKKQNINNKEIGESNDK